MRFMIRPVFLAALFLGACGGDDGNGTGSTSTPPPSGDTTGDDGTQETIVAVNCANVTSNVTISIVNQSFSDREVDIPNNGIVRWINNDTLVHDITSGEPGHSDAGALFRSGNLAPGQSFCVQLAGDVEVDYFCSIHPEMQGEIDVGNVPGDDDNRGGGNDDPDNPSGDDDDDSSSGSDDDRDRT